MPSRAPVDSGDFSASARVAVLPPLVGVHVPVAGADHGPRRPGPVQRVGQRQPAGDRPALLLADVVRPAAAVAAHAAGQHQQRQHRPVGGVAVEPLADPGAHDDHGPALGLLGVAGEFAGHPDAGLRRDGGDLLLPGRGVGRRGVVVAGGPVPRQPVAAHAVLGQHQVEHGGDQLAFRPPGPARRGGARCRAPPASSKHGSRISALCRRRLRAATAPVRSPSRSRFHLPSPLPE